MPRQARLDIPGLLQHVIVRGIDLLWRHFARNLGLVTVCPAQMDLNSLQASVSDYFKLPAAAVLRRGRRNQYSEARELFCYLAVRELGYSCTKVGALIGMGTPSVSRSVRRGEELITVRPELKDWWITELKQ